jgi:cell division control protein 6
MLYPLKLTIISWSIESKVISLSIDKMREELSAPGQLIINDEPLSPEFIPSHLPGRESELSVLIRVFEPILEKPMKVSQNALIRGRIGTGKTVLVQRFGRDFEKIAREKGINFYFIAVNCRQFKGSSFMILKHVITKFSPAFPQRGFSSEELLQMLLQMLDDKNAYLFLALDELESLIQNEGSDPLYNLTRIHEARFNAPQRLSCIFVLRDHEFLDRLDKATLSTLNRNVLHLEEYTAPQLVRILSDRVKAAFREHSVPLETIEFIADLAATEPERGEARYAIELLRRAGIQAQNERANRILPEHIRKAAASVPHPVYEDIRSTLSVHQKLLLLAIARRFKHTEDAYLSMGQVEEVYRIICEEYRKKPLRHTQVWKYLKDLSNAGVLTTKASGQGQRGKTTLIGGVSGVSNDVLEKEMERLLEVR